MTVTEQSSVVQEFVVIVKHDMSGKLKMRFPLYDTLYRVSHGETVPISKDGSHHDVG